MERAYEEAFAEVDEIFKTMPIDILSKIPIKFRQIISENKAKDYKVEINFESAGTKRLMAKFAGLEIIN